jgi:phenylalanyl-tRNA synthetase beta chain
MRVSYQWLRELVDGELPPVERVAELLTGAGLEVEGIERQGQGLDRVVVGEVLSKDPVAGSDHLNLCRVDVGGETLSIVCGASNYGVGAKVPTALVGAHLPNGMAIKKAKLRGVESHGMLCSARELGLAEDASGLLLLPASARPGTPIVAELGLDDVALEVNATPNRPDWLSHVGVARELAPLCGLSLKLPPADVPETGDETAQRIEVRIPDPERCGRYAARVVEGVTFGESPAWMRRRLELCGVRALGNLIDVTNYVLLEVGQPLHAFDLDKMRGGVVQARRAAEGEKLVTLDGKERTLTADDLVIADAERPLVIAGVFGGADAEVDAGTKRVLLEGAWFQPAGIRRTARRQALHTESSHRFERTADIGIIPWALDRAARLIAELAGGEVRRGRVDNYPARREPARVRIRYRRVNDLLGTEVPPEETRRILVSLGLSPLREDEEGLELSVPTFRTDLTREADLIEEVARVRGYDRIPTTARRPSLEVPPEDRKARVAARIHGAMGRAGLDEAVNFSFADPRDLAVFHGGEAKTLPLRNPLVETQAVMRTGLLPGLLRNVEFNLNRQAEDVRLYELGTVFFPEPGDDRPVREEGRVAGVLVGRRNPPSWTEKPEPVDFWDAKGAVEAILAALGIRDAEWTNEDAPHLHPRSACAVSVGGKLLGRLGEIHPTVAEGFGLPRGVFAFELSLDRLEESARFDIAYAGVPRFPAVLRDLAVLVDETVPVARIVAALRGPAGKGLVEQVELFDVYLGAQVPPGKKSLAFAIRYRAADRTLTDEEVTGAHQALVAALEREVGAMLRA